LSQPRRRRCNASVLYRACRTNFTCRLSWRITDRYDDARMDHFFDLPGSRRPHCTWRRHACSWSLAMEYHRVLRPVERCSSLWSSASRAGGMETVPARSQVPVGKPTQCLLV